MDEHKIKLFLILNVFNKLFTNTNYVTTTNSTNSMRANDIFQMRSKYEFIIDKRIQRLAPPGGECSCEYLKNTQRMRIDNFEITFFYT